MALFQNLIVTATAFLSAASTANSAPLDLNQFRWKSRVLLVFAAANDTPALVKQRMLLHSHLGDVSERDLVIVEVIRGNAIALGQPSIHLSGETLEKEYRAGTGDFKVVLVGKDGGSKLEQNTPLEAAELFGTIDAMPMRRSEMR